MCPLVVLGLWRPDSDTGFDSANCRRIFSMYASGWVLKFHPNHLRILGVCTVQNVLFILSSLMHVYYFPNLLVFQRLIGLIAEVTIASEPNSKNVHPHTGDCCDNLSRKLSDALKSKRFYLIKTINIFLLQRQSKYLSFLI